MRALALAGAKVTIADRDADLGKELAAEIGGEFVAADVTERRRGRGRGRSGSRRARRSADLGLLRRHRLGRAPGPLARRPRPRHFANVIKVNLVGTFNVLRTAATAMIENEPDDGGERGVCVNTASIAAFDGQIGQVAYAASKGGVVGMTLPAARDLASKGVRVMTIAPGVFDTPPAGRSAGGGAPLARRGSAVPQPLGNPEEYAQLVTQIVANPMLNGETIRLDGALRMTPK